MRQAIIKTVENEQVHNQAKAILLNEKVRKKIPDNMKTIDIIHKFRKERYGSKTTTDENNNA